MKAFWLTFINATCAATAAFFVFQFAQMSIVSLFGSESSLYNEFAVKSFRIFLLFCILDGFQTVSSIFVQAIGRPVSAMILSLSRQIVFLIPAVLILPKFLGIDGILWAGPVADGLAFILAIVVSIIDVRKVNLLSSS
ncbi:MAG: hypothetical protein LKE40_09210 [Spirochaetia bacterium]|jgi:Na+-driven multidrug efflux pump|nr:hypothetical protein [Spirochaetia bacterium]